MVMEVHPPREPKGAPGNILKNSVGKKKLHKDENRVLARICYQSFVINGVQYCRPHLLVKCSLCEEDNVSLQEECDAERQLLGLRQGGDPHLNARAERWHEEITDAQLYGTLKANQVRMMYSESYRKAHPREFAVEWRNMMVELNTKEKDLHDRLLAEAARTVKEGASECCYWACAEPSGASADALAEEKSTKLFRCSGCGVAKYCSKEHQMMDWKWEHKMECSKSVPQFFLEEIEEDRRRHLRGDYEKVDRNG
jgi:hypothetical protein